MKKLITITVIMCVTGAAMAQQQMLPLTEWRAQLDYELARVPMTREAHGQVIGILQAAEKQAQAEKAAKQPPKEGQ